MKYKIKKTATIVTTKTNFKAVVSALRREWTRWKKRFEETVYTSIKKKKERKAALVTEKMPKLGNSYNLLTGSVLRGKFSDFFSLFIKLDK